MITLPPELENRIAKQASRAGLSVEAWLRQQVLRQELEEFALPTASLQDDVTPEEWVRQFRTWAESHDRGTPLLSDLAEDTSSSHNAE